ncbi:MAG: bifunctional oligoribonuclease/PAP phosphatase NrnA [Candidatus Omnitrophota bacterium]|nr:bifunctional oligoribonuclease/PAP phosphatase NrnA [Candidatus Omnitrophota bacterium]
MSLKKVIACLKENKSFFITTHTNVEGDALGSELSFCMLLQAMGKKVFIFNQELPPQEYLFLPGIEAVQKLSRRASKLKFDIFAAVDCSNLKRTGEVYKINDGNKAILNIDHHISNSGFGSINWIDSQASCCCEMIYRLYKELKIPISREVALLLYSGIVTDTGSFRYSNTNKIVHRITAELLRHKINVAEIYQSLYQNIPFGDIKLLVNLLSDIQTDRSKRIVWFRIPGKILKKADLSVDLSDYILNFGRQVRDVEVILLFKENSAGKNEVKVSFRSQGKVDVNTIAGFFGGGGHKSASSCTVSGNLLQAQQKVLKKVKESLAKK